MELKSHIFGPNGSRQISSRKMIALLARAAGAHVFGKEAGWLYVAMRKNFEPFPGEESDEEETGHEDGPGGTTAHSVDYSQMIRNYLHGWPTVSP